MPVPGRSHLVGLLQDETRDTRLFEASADGQPGRPRANDNRMVMTGIMWNGYPGRREIGRHLTYSYRVNISEPAAQWRLG